MHSRFLLFIAVVAAWFQILSPARGASVITATITVTNIPGVGSNWTVNGNTRIWTNNTGTPPASWIRTGASVGASATNLYNSILANGYQGVIPGRSSTNIITLRGTSLTVTTNNYFSLVYTTNQGTNLNILQLPLENVDYATNRTNNAHWLVDAINRFVYTNAISTNANVGTNFLTKGASPLQEVKGPIHFQGRVAVTSNFFATNGFTDSITNINPKFSNAVNYGSAIRSEGAGGNSFQIGSNAQALGFRSFASGNSALAEGDDGLAIGNYATNRTNNGTAIGTLSLVDGVAGTAHGWGSYATNLGTAVGALASAAGVQSTAIGRSASASGESSFAGGDQADASGYFSLGLLGAATAPFAIAIGGIAGFSNSAAFGPTDHAGNFPTTDSTNQIMLGTSLEQVRIPGQLLISGTQSNTTFKGTNIAGGAWAYPAFSLTTLSAGNNIAVPFGTNRYIRCGAGPASAATICGIVGGATTGGMNGQDILVFNDTGFTLTFAVNTTDPVPANRINTPTTASISISDQCWAWLIYDATDARWKVVNTFSGTSSGGAATNAIASVWTNGVPVSGAATNINLIISTANAILATNTSGNVDVEIVLAAGSGEANVNGETSITNATKIGLVAGKASVTNLLRSVQAGNGVVLTNQGTNIMFAIDPAVVASQANLTAASNSLITEIITSSNNLRTIETTRNAAVSNSVITEIGTSSNNLWTAIPLRVTNANVIRVNHFSGNDLTAIKYTAKAYSNIWAAASNAVSGDTIIADAGDYPQAAESIKLPDGVSLFGAAGNSYVSFTNNSSSLAMIIPGNNSRVQNLWFRAFTPIGSGGIQKIITSSPVSGSKFWSNSVFAFCTFEGQTDTLAVDATTPTSGRFDSCNIFGYWDGILTLGAPHYYEYNNCVVRLDGRFRGSYDPTQIAADWSATILKTQSGSSNIFNNCWLVATNTGVNSLWADIPGEMGAFIVRDSSGTGYHTNWTVFNSCTFGCAGTNASFTNFSPSMFSGPSTNAWMNSNHVVLFYNCTPQDYYPPSYGMYEANTYCASWGDGNIHAPNASTRIVRLPNAGPNGSPFFKGQRLTVIDENATASGTNISITTRGGQTINGQASTNVVLDRGRITLEVGGLGDTNWIVVSASSSSSAGGSSGPTTNAPPYTIAINSGLGSTNILIDMLALGATNDIEATLTANAGLMVTNVVKGKLIRLAIFQDATGQRTLVPNATYGTNFNLRFGRDVTGINLVTNGGFFDLFSVYGVRTNAALSGNLTGFAP